MYAALVLANVEDPMPATREDLQKAIEETERELAQLKAANRIMERRDGFASKSSTRADSVIAATISESGAIDIDEIEFTRKPANLGTTLVTDIRSLIGRLGSQEFTVSHVNAILRKMGKGSEAKHFKNRISITTRKLADEGLITRTHKGSGNDPHRYRVAKEVGEEKTGSESLREEEPSPGAGLGLIGSTI